MKKITKRPKFSRILKHAALSIYYMLPMILGVLGLSAILITFIKPEQVKQVFTGMPLTDTIYGLLLGAIMMGNAVLSYILGGELLKMGISLYAVTAFLLAWITLGIVQIPMEIEFFGKRFVIVRNMMAIVFTLITSLLIVVTYETIK